MWKSMYSNSDVCRAVNNIDIFVRQDYNKKTPYLWIQYYFMIE